MVAGRSPLRFQMSRGFRWGVYGPITAAVAVAGLGAVLALGHFLPKGTVQGKVIQYVCNGPVPCWVMPAKDERVTFTANTSHQIYVASTDANGSFTISLPPGTYSIDIPTAPYSWAADKNRLTRIDVGPDSVNVRPNERLTITLQIAPNQT